MPVGKHHSEKEGEANAIGKAVIWKNLDFM
jgi:hypothetical protein